MDKNYIYKNIFITGRRNCGKSTLINEVLKETNSNYSGYRTFPYKVEGKEAGYYLKSLQKDNISSCIISVKLGEGRVKPIIENFNLTGYQILKNSIEDKDSNIIVLDEIGFLENDAKKFKNEIIKCIQSNKLVLGVLKKQDTELFSNIVHRKDTLIIDIENIPCKIRTELKKFLVNIIKTYKNM